MIIFKSKVSFVSIRCLLSCLCVLWNAGSYGQTKNATVEFSEISNHVVLISIDGLRPEMYLDSTWPTPNLQHLMEEGTSANYMTSVFPSFTYPAHVAMLTGAMPARGGIYYNAPRNSNGDWNWFTKDIKVPTLWQALKQQGMTTSAVQWPVSVGSEITYNIPEIWNSKHPEDRITETRKHATPGLIEEIEKEATGTLSSENMDEEFPSMDANAGRMAAYILKAKKPNLLAVHFASVDGAQHGYGRDHEKVKQALANVDNAIGHILETLERNGLKDNTTVLIVGDHGFCTINKVIKPNVWIKDLKARFQPAGGAAFLYLNDKGDKKTVKEVTNRLNNLPEETKKLFKIFDKSQLDKMGVDPDAMLGLTTIPDYVFGGKDAGAPMENLDVTRGHHGYDPNLPEMYTGFIAAGAGVQKNNRIETLNVADIAPLVVRLLDIEFTCPDGVLSEGIIVE